MANNFMTQKNCTFVPEFKNEMKWISLINIQLLDPFSISIRLILSIFTSYGLFSELVRILFYDANTRSRNLFNSLYFIVFHTYTHPQISFFRLLCSVHDPFTGRLTIMSLTFFFLFIHEIKSSKEVK